MLSPCDGDTASRTNTPVSELTRSMRSPCPHPPNANRTMYLPQHKEPKLDMAKRVISGPLFEESWVELDGEVRAFEESRSSLEAGGGDAPSP